MAYMNFSETQGGRTDVFAALLNPPAEETESGFTALEWSVVALARRDSLSSLREPGRLSVALGVLFGERQNPRLADPRLEALRRMSVHGWHKGFAVPKSEIVTFKSAGFTMNQLETLLTSISEDRATRDRSHYA
jgi:hypothetical protein